MDLSAIGWCGASHAVTTDDALPSTRYTDHIRHLNEHLQIIKPWTSCQSGVQCMTCFIDLLQAEKLVFISAMAALENGNGESLEEMDISAL